MTTAIKIGLVVEIIIVPCERPIGIVINGVSSAASIVLHFIFEDCFLLICYGGAFKRIGLPQKQILVILSELDYP